MVPIKYVIDEVVVDKVVLGEVAHCEVVRMKGYGEKWSKMKGCCTLGC